MAKAPALAAFVLAALARPAAALCPRECVYDALPTCTSPTDSDTQVPCNSELLLPYRIYTPIFLLATLAFLVHHVRRIVAYRRQRRARRAKGITMQGAALYSLLPCSIANVIYFGVFVFQVFATTSSLALFQTLTYLDGLSVGTTIAFIVVPFLQLIMFWIDLVSGVGGMAYLSKPSLRYTLFALIVFTVCIEYSFRIADAQTTASLDGEALNAFFVLGYRVYLLSLIISVSLFALFAVNRLRKSTAFGRQQSKRNAAAKGVKHKRGQVETITYYIWIIQWVSLAIIAITAIYVAASFLLGKHSTALHMTYLIFNDTGKIIFSIVALIILKPRKAVRVTKNMSEYSINGSSRRSVSRKTVSSAHSIQSLREANAAADDSAASEDENSRAALVDDNADGDEASEEGKQRKRGATIHQSAKTGMKIRLHDREPTAEELAADEEAEEEVVALEEVQLDDESAEDAPEAADERERAATPEPESKSEPFAVPLAEPEAEQEAGEAKEAGEAEEAEAEPEEPEPEEAKPEPEEVKPEPEEPEAEPEPAQPEANETPAQSEAEKAADNEKPAANDDSNAATADEPALSKAAQNSIAEEEKAPAARMSLAERRRAQGRPSIQARTGRATQQFGRQSIARPSNRDSVAGESDWVPLD